jgi:cysteine-rich repeat protein
VRGVFGLEPILYLKMVRIKDYSKLLKKAQVSIEFIAIISFIMFIFVGLLIIFNNRMNDAITEKDRLQVEHVKEQLYGQLYNAVKAMNGYSTEYTMSALIEGEFFNMTIEDDVTLLIKYKNKDYVFPLPVGITGKINPEAIGARQVYVLVIKKDMNGKVTVTSSCGDGNIQGTEECDDGDYDNYDNCKNDCTNNICPDGYANFLLGANQCDDGNAVDGDCCDSGCNIESGCVCNPVCHVVVCGDGTKEGTEGCDPPNPGFGCDASCKVEPGFVCCGTSPTVCTPSTGCGDGVLNESSETCDDNNIVGLPIDGCSATCTVDSGWACNNACGQTSSCHKIVCGDGIVDSPAEECDIALDPVNCIPFTCALRASGTNLCIFPFIFNCILT